MTVTISAYLGFLLLAARYDTYIRYPSNEVATPLIYITYLLILAMNCVIIWALIRFQTKDSNKYSRLLAICVVIIGFTVPFSFSYDYHWGKHYYLNHIDEVINEASNTNKQHCNVIQKIYFKNDETDNDSFYYRKYYKPYHPYLFEKDALELCKVTSNAVIQDDYRYCFIEYFKAYLHAQMNGTQLKESLYDKDNYRYDSEMHYEKVYNSSICLSIYIKHHQDKRVEAMDYSAELLVEHGFITENKFKSVFNCSEYKNNEK